MQLSPQISHAPLYIRSYQPGQCLINETLYKESVILFGKDIIEDQLPTQFSGLTEAHLKPFIECDADVLILGTGIHHEHLPLPWLKPFHLKNRTIDTMTTELACQTYNMLAQDSRKIFAGLILEPLT